jgi:nicotinate-nucleotide--dimethylbenzimidazole phosphoribosyltransferase
MLKQTLTEIKPVSREWLDQAWERLNNLVKPRGSLGRLEEMAARIVAILEQPEPLGLKKEVFVFASDHGVVSEGVSVYPQEVTGLMVQNFLAGIAGINVIARCAGAYVSVIDIGMKSDLEDAQGLIRRNIKRGGGNILYGPAMTPEEAEQAIDVGIDMAYQAHDKGTAIIATGEMGIGNTTPSAALLSVLLSVSPADVTGKGTGVEEDVFRRKIKVIEKALKTNHPDPKDPLSCLAAVGGLEIAAICGLCLGGAAKGMVVVVDGFISSVGALVAMRLNPLVKEYLFFSHQSSEKGHAVFFEKEKIRPILDLDLRLGEGTGAALAIQIMENALRVYTEMATFEEAGIEPVE